MPRRTLYLFFIAVVTHSGVHESSACKNVISSSSGSQVEGGDGSSKSTWLRCGLCGKDIGVSLIVRNQYQKPYFEHQVMIKDTPQRELFHHLQTAADMDPHFKFSADYYGSLGFMITKMNGVSGSVENQTYWQILEHPTGLSLQLGVSSYVPLNGDAIMFNFTTWAMDSDH